jgi:aspartate/methionine/tyrosine aminotransferase
VVHPNNPTGHFTKPWEAEFLARICRAYSLSLIVDEVFLDYAGCSAGLQTGCNVGLQTHVSQNPTPSPSRHNPPKADRGNPAATPAWSFAAGIDGVPVFVVSGLSKIVGLPQMKVAWIVATGPERAQALERLEVVADTFLSMNAPVQWALPAWLAGRKEIQQQIQNRVSANLAELDRQLATAPALQRLAVEGGWYAILRIPALQPDEQTALDLLSCGVWVHPGYFFGLPESGWLVVSLLTPEEEFLTGVTTFVNYFETNQSSKI